MKKNLYFIPRNTWFYTTFSQFPAYVRYCITFMVVCVIFFLWLFTSYNTFAKMQSNYNVSVENLYEQKKKFEKVQQDTKQLEIKLEHKKCDFNHLTAQSTHHSSYVQELLQMMQQYSLALQTYTPQSRHTKKWYTKYTIRIDSTGSYENVLLFMQHVTTSNLPMICSYIHLEKQPEGILASFHISWYNIYKDGNGKKVSTLLSNQRNPFEFEDEHLKK